MLKRDHLTINPPPAKSRRKQLPQFRTSFRCHAPLAIVSSSCHRASASAALSARVGRFGLGLPRRTFSSLMWRTRPVWSRMTTT